MFEVVGKSRHKGFRVTFEFSVADLQGLGNLTTIWLPSSDAWDKAP
jgi:hypothetical protein